MTTRPEPVEGHDGPSTGSGRVTAGPSSLDELSETGERIEALISALSTGGPVAQQRAEDLVAVVNQLYGAGLGRMLDVLHEAGRLDDTALAALAADELVSGLLLVHGLHPHDVSTRVAGALDSVRPYLGSHGGDVELLEVTDEGVVRLRLLGSCDSCPSSTVTLQLAVEGAIQAAAPEVTSIEVATPPGSSAGGMIPVEALRVRLDNNEGGADGGADWVPLPALEELGVGELGGFRVDDVSLVAARLGGDVFAYRDHCPSCRSTLEGARLERRLGDSAEFLIMICPHCRARFDVRRAGVALDSDHHLEPLPILRRSGVLSVAVPAGR